TVGHSLHHVRIPDFVEKCVHICCFVSILHKAFSASLPAHRQHHAPCRKLGTANVQTLNAFYNIFTPKSAFSLAFCHTNAHFAGFLSERSVSAKAFGKSLTP
ncbi:MAG: hypothetical protein IKT26_02875, partial [Bacteroidaceae bacterium]|nr:hypothetical protein [Bacteroidaceae bacterium]